MSLHLSPVRSDRDRHDFLALPDRLHRRDPAYVAPLWRQRRHLVDPARNPWFRHAEAEFLLARRQGRAVGRVSVQVDRLAVEAHGPIAHFGLLAAEDEHIVAALMESAESWARARGLGGLRGPFNLSVNQECGLQVDGFGAPSTLLTPHDLPLLAPALRSLGYGKAMDLLAYEARVDHPPPHRPPILPDGVRLRPLDASAYGRELGEALAVFNDAWSGNWGFVPMTADEIAGLARDLKPLLDPRLTVFAECDGQVAGMLIALPDLNRALAGLGGRLWPFGWARLWWRLKARGVDGARVPLMGVRRSFAATALGAVLPFAMIENLRPELARQGYQRVEMSWILEDNRPMRRLAERMGGAPVRRWRIFHKDLP